MPRRHCAFTVEKTAKGWRVDNVTEWLARGDADRMMLRMTGKFGDATRSATLDHDLKDGDLLPDLGPHGH